MTVVMSVSVLGVKCKHNPAFLPDLLVNLYKAGQNIRKGHVPSQGKIKVFREPVIMEVTTLERCTALKDQILIQGRPGQTDEKPGLPGSIDEVTAQFIP